jgi:protein-tyrosine-phosphatase
MRRKINIDVYVHPEKHLLVLPIEKIVADTKVSRKIIEFYKRKIVTGETLFAIVVIKNPGKDIYAVLDGHHRYYACLELGKKEVECAFAGDFSGLVFTMARIGFFQPATEIVEYTTLIFHTGVRNYVGKGIKQSRLFFQKLRTLSLGIFFTPTEWTRKSSHERKILKNDTKFKVLFVCTGNAYRSVICEALLKKLKPDLEVDSAGTQIATEITKEAREYLTSEGAVQYLKKTPESLNSKQVEQYNVIIAMQQRHRDAVLKKCPECKNKIVVWNVRDKSRFFHKRTKKINSLMKKYVTEYAESLA